MGSRPVQVSSKVDQRHFAKPGSFKDLTMSAKPQFSFFVERVCNL